MKRLALLLIALLTCLPALADDAPKAEHPDAANWKPLFRPDLSNATFPEGVWSMTDGVLTATEDQIIWTNQDYDNFILDLEFKLEPNANSGVFVYGSDMGKWTTHSVEVQILDDSGEKWADAPASWKCGALFGLQPAKMSAVRPAGEWNHMTISCRDRRIDVVLNGRLVNEIDLGRWTSKTKNPDGTDIPPWIAGPPKAELPTKGRIGLQGKHAGAPIYFRNLKVHEFE